MTELFSDNVGIVADHAIYSLLSFHGDVNYSYCLGYTGYGFQGRGTGCGYARFGGIKGAGSGSAGLR